MWLSTETMLNASVSCGVIQFLPRPFLLLQCYYYMSVCFKTVGFLDSEQFTPVVYYYWTCLWK